MRKTVQISAELKKEYPNIHFSTECLDRFEQYFKMLQQWNSKMNLTAIRDRNLMITKHLLDSLAVFRTSLGHDLLAASAKSMLDLGAGAGIPGILIQILNPSLKLLSIDKSKKKIGFQEYVKAKLGLINLEPISERVETLMLPAGSLEKSLDFIVSRAFVQIKDLFEYSRFFLAPEGAMILWKGREWQKELADVPAGLAADFKLIETCNYHFHQAQIGGTILIIKRSAPV